MNRVCRCLSAALALARQHDERIQNRQAWEVGLAGLPDAQEARNVILSDEKVREFTRQHVEKEGAMQPEDVAAAIVFAVSLPPRVNISQLVIRPTVDARVL